MQNREFIIHAHIHTNAKHAYFLYIHRCQTWNSLIQILTQTELRNSLLILILTQTQKSKLAIKLIHSQMRAGEFTLMQFKEFNFFTLTRLDAIQGIHH